MRTSTMIKTLSLALLWLAVSSSLCTHDEPLGKWPKMEWVDHSGLSKNGDVYLVPSSGGTYTFSCVNYSSPWLSSAEDDDGVLWPGMKVTEDGDTLLSYDNIDWFYISGSWYEAQCCKSDFSLSVAPLADGITSRELCVTVTAGDIFDTFRFRQSN